MIRGLLRIALYLGIGPFVGLIGASLALGFGTLATTGRFNDFAGWEAFVSPPILIAAYTLGLLPALLTAIVSIVIERQLKGWAHWLWAGLAGAIISTVLAWLMFGTAPVGQGMQPVAFTVVIASAGAVAGFACAALFDALAALLRRR
jgi:hypothetical protein